MTKLTAKDLMTGNVEIAKTSWSIEHLTEVLLSRSISGAPVANEAGKLVGVVSVTDITRSQSAREQDSDNHPYYQQIREVQFGEDILEDLSVTFEPTVTVGDIMTPVVFEVAEDTSVQDVAEMMLTGRIHRVFVTNDGQLTGVLSAFDLLRVVRDS